MVMKSGSDGSDEQDYLVELRIDVSAPSSEAAALQAEEYATGVHTQATIYTVIDRNGDEVDVDVSELKRNYPVPFTVFFDANAGENKAAVPVFAPAGTKLHEVIRDERYWRDALIEAIAEDYCLSLVDDNDIEEAEEIADSFVLVAAVEGHPRFNLAL